MKIVGIWLFFYLLGSLSLRLAPQSYGKGQTSEGRYRTHSRMSRLGPLVMRSSNPKSPLHSSTSPSPTSSSRNKSSIEFPTWVLPSAVACFIGFCIGQQTTHLNSIDQFVAALQVVPTSLRYLESMYNATPLGPAFLVWAVLQCSGAAVDILEYYDKKSEDAGK